MALLATAGGRVNKQPKLAAVDESDATPERQLQPLNEPDESAIRDTVEHFCRLLEKSKQLFNGLRYARGDRRRRGCCCSERNAACPRAPYLRAHKQRANCSNNC